MNNEGSVSVNALNESISNTIAHKLAVELPAQTRCCRKKQVNRKNGINATPYQPNIAYDPPTIPSVRSFLSPFGSTPACANIRSHIESCVFSPFRTLGTACWKAHRAGQIPSSP